MTREERGPTELLAFLHKLDSFVEADHPVELYLGGGAAILLVYGGQLATDDVNVIGPREAAENGGLLDVFGECPVLSSDSVIIHSSSREMW